MTAALESNPQDHLRWLAAHRSDATPRQVATIPLLKHKADDDAAYRQQQQQAWQAMQNVNRPSTSHPTAVSAVSQRPPRPASVAALPSGIGVSAVDTGTLYVICFP